MANILLVDDDPLLSKMYKTKFDKDGHQVMNASDGLDLFEKLKEFTPDLIVLDMMMPKMNGLEALEKLKTDEGTKQIPVVMLTNVGSSEEESQKALELGAVTYIVKADYVPKEIVQKIDEILEASAEDLPEVKTQIKESKETKKVVEKAPAETEQAEEKEEKPKAAEPKQKDQKIKVSIESI